MVLEGASSGSHEGRNDGDRNFFRFLMLEENISSAGSWRCTRRRYGAPLQFCGGRCSWNALIPTYWSGLFTIDLSESRVGACSAA